MKSVGPSGGFSGAAALLFASKKGAAMMFTVLTSNRRASLLLRQWERGTFFMRVLNLQSNVFKKSLRSAFEDVSTTLVGLGKSGPKNTRSAAPISMGKNGRLGEAAI